MEIKTGKDGTKLILQKIGDKQVRKIKDDGRVQEFILQDVKIVPNLVANLILIPTTLNSGFQLKNSNSEQNLYKKRRFQAHF